MHQVFVGATIGRLHVIQKELTKPRLKKRWLCRCECGTEKSIGELELKRGQSRSCGCLRREATGARFSSADNFDEKSTFRSNRRMYSTRASMISRCYNPRSNSFMYYGARGIEVCARWRFGENGRTGFQCFLDDMGEKPGPGFSIDRIDNEQGYSKENCRWATLSEQARNKRKPAAHQGLVHESINYRP